MHYTRNLGSNLSASCTVVCSITLISLSYNFDSNAFKLATESKEILFELFSIVAFSTFWEKFQKELKESQLRPEIYEYINDKYNDKE